MSIDVKTAMMILDVLQWCNDDWMKVLDWSNREENATGILLDDFKRYCEERGIEYVEGEIEE